MRFVRFLAKRPKNITTEGAILSIDYDIHISKNMRSYCFSYKINMY